MDTFATKEGSVALHVKGSMRSSRNRTLKTKLSSPKKMISYLLSKTSSGKLEAGLMQVFTEHIRDGLSFQNFFRPDNKDKNVSMDVWLFDATRVILKDGPDYYHASNVEGLSRANQYILAAAPFNSTTQGDFFRMLLQIKPDALVIVAKHDSDIGKLSVPRGESKYGGVTVRVDQEKLNEQLGVFNVTLNRSTKFKAFTLNKQNGEKILPKDMSDCHDKIRADITWVNKGTIVMICTDGIGKSAAFCLLDMEAERARTKTRIKLAESVKQIRVHRMNALEHFEMFDGAAMAVAEMARKAEAPQKG